MILALIGRRWRRMQTGVIRSLENLGITFTSLADWFMIIWGCLS